MADLRLVATEGADQGGEHEIGDGLTLGREQTDIVIDDPGISREHATVRNDGGRVTVEDLGSSNGTFVNGEQIGGPTELTEGDKVQVGGAVYELRGADDPTRMMAGSAPPTEQHSPPTAAHPGPAQPAQPPPPPQRAPEPAAPPTEPEVARPSSVVDEQNLPALAAFFFGPLSIILLLFTSGAVFYVSLPMAIAAIVLGSAGKRKVDRKESDRYRGLAMAGQICGIIGAVLSTLAIIAVLIISTVLDATSNSLNEVIDNIRNEIEGAEGDLIQQGQDAAGQ